jgi:hypothetical protein
MRIIVVCKIKRHDIRLLTLSTPQSTKMRANEQFETLLPSAFLN